MYQFIRWCTAIATMTLALSAQALTYQPMLDDDLLDQSPVVVRGNVLFAGEQVTGVRQYQLAVEQVYKGQLPVNEITFTVPGSYATGLRVLPGVPTFSAGEQVVLFLAPDDDGSYRLVHLSLGAFFAERNARGQSVYKRRLAGTRALQGAVPSRSAVAEAPRMAASFLGWLGDPLAEFAASTLNAEAAGEGRTEQDEFSTLGSGNPSRWWQFDQGQQVAIRAHADGQAGMPGGGFTEFRTGLAAWNNDPGSNVNYFYAGTTEATGSGGTSSGDGVTMILFDDPNGEVNGTFSCSSGGVLAIGGFTTSGRTMTLDGQRFEEIVEGDIVTNNGAGCFFALQNNSNGEEVFAHEIGHTLGLGHSCEESGGGLLDLDGLFNPSDCTSASPAELDAIMKSTPHADGRGADLRADDQAGIAFLYPQQGGSNTTDPDAGSDSDEDTTPAAGGGGGGGGGGGCALGSVAGLPDSGLPVMLTLSLVFLLLRRRRAASIR